MSEWQSIETAPKDGTHILACAGRYSKHWTFAQAPPFVVHYWDNPGEEGFYLSSGGGDLDAIDPSHWMPLPAPPHPILSPQAEAAQETQPKEVK